MRDRKTHKGSPDTHIALYAFFRLIAHLPYYFGYFCQELTHLLTDEIFGL